MKDPTIASEARRLMRMARGRQRSLKKRMKPLEERIEIDSRTFSVNPKMFDKLDRLTKQSDTWEQVIDWLTKQLAMLDEEQNGGTDDDDIRIGFTNAITDEEKREILGKLTPDMTRAFAQAYADFIFRCEEVGIRVSGVSFYPEAQGKPQND